MYFCLKNLSVYIPDYLYLFLQHLHLLFAWCSPRAFSWNYDYPLESRCIPWKTTSTYTQNNNTKPYAVYKNYHWNPVYFWSHSTILVRPLMSAKAYIWQYTRSVDALWLSVVFEKKTASGGFLPFLFLNPTWIFTQIFTRRFTQNHRFYVRNGFSGGGGAAHPLKFF